jgi:2-succinyl-5-enolpyruvyl-6-hydroxy-3-cyclohexene-1-carboxylate synthase
MEATTLGSRRILECAEEAKSPQRILVRSLLKSRNKLRAKYRDLRAECKRWRNQVAAVEKSRSAWCRRALTAEAALQNEQAERAMLQAQEQKLRESSTAPDAALAGSPTRPTALERAEKKGR